jgi:hypothetical protein
MMRVRQEEIHGKPQPWAGNGPCPPFRLTPFCPDFREVERWFFEHAKEVFPRP